MKMFKYLFILFISLFFSCGSSISYEEQVKNYTMYVNKSDSLMKIEKYEKAISYSNAAIEITDTLPTAIYLKGLASYKLNLLDEAEDSFTKVIEIEGLTSEAYKDRAKVYFKNGDNDFIDDIEIYIKNNPNDNEASILKREYLERREEFEQAINEYSIAIEKNKNDTLLLSKRAELYFKNGDYEKSIKDYDHLLRLNPENKQADKKKNEILFLVNEKSNRNIFIIILLCFYVIYVTISHLILKPLVEKKAVSQIGGELEISKDPVIWILPIVLVLTFFILSYTNSIPNF
uniref:Tetratricopeptide repeat protein n=1 Tax=Tenacibaculum sp. Pbs-1 TaxID=3238748 RepID=A0AB33KUR8_9FLAO